MKKIIYLLFAVLSIFSYKKTSAQSFQIFIKALDQNGVLLNGGSTVAGRTNFIEALSYSNAITGCSSISGVCAPKLSDYSFYMLFNAAAITLKQMILSSYHLKSVDVYYRRSNQTFDFYKIHMEDVIITSVQESGAEGGDIAPAVTVSVLPVKIAWQFTATKSDGTSGVQTKTGWDFSTNTQWSFF
jgi:type VI protein secretion system component Hcp